MNPNPKYNVSSKVLRKMMTSPKRGKFKGAIVGLMFREKMGLRYSSHQESSVIS